MYVQSAANCTPTGSGTKHLTQAYGSGVIAGNVLTVIVCSNIETPSISDTIGTSYSLKTSIDDTGDGERIQVWVGVAPSSGANTVDVTYSALIGDGWIAICEHSGRSGTVSVTATSKMNPTGLPPIFNIPNGSTISINAHDDIITASVITGAYVANTWSAGTGFTKREEPATGSVKLDGMLQTQDDVSANGAYSATANNANSGDVGVGLLIALAQAGGTNVNPTGLSAGTSIGSPSVLLSAVRVSPTGLAANANLGTPTNNISGSNVSPVGLLATATLGTPAVNTLVLANPAGFLATASLGTFLTEVDTTLLGNFGLLASTSQGTPTVNIQNGTGSNVTLNPTGLLASTSIGLPQLHVDNNFTVTGLLATTSLGQPAFSALTLNPVGLVANTSVGTPTLVISATTKTPTGLLATTSLGVPRTFFGAGGANKVVRGFVGVGVGV